MKHSSRRVFLQQAGVVLAGAWSNACAPNRSRFTDALMRDAATRSKGSAPDMVRHAGVRDAGGQAWDAREPEVRDAARGASDTDATANVDIELALTAVKTQAQILRGTKTDVWTVRGQVLRGARDSVLPVESGALGPTLHVRRGQRLRIVLDNQLSEDTTLHWHGLHVPAAMDGQPRNPIAPGARYVYEFDVRNRAGTYFYHAHPHARSGPQVYYGMAGLFIVHDDEQDALELPDSEFDVPLVIQDRLFDADNQLVYQASPHLMAGWLGDRVLINGVPDYVLQAATRPYRLRLVNASNSRIYQLAWQDDTPLTVIGTDGGLLGQPAQRPYVMLAPGERIELWADFAGRTLGSELSLVSRAFTAGMNMGATGAGLPQGAAVAVMRVKFDRPSNDRPELPRSLPAIARYQPADASNAGAPRRIVAAMQHMRFTLNGRSFELDQVADDERVRLDSLELWQFENPTSGSGMMHGGMGMMAMPHPMHLHSGQFQVVERTGVAHQGYVDTGWKDTVLVMPGETAKVAVRYEDYSGVYLYHCHNLEHEDAGMMRNFEVVV